jgi:hypothetical protein
MSIFRECLILWANHEGTKSQRHQESFVPSSLGGFVVNQSPSFWTLPIFHSPKQLYIPRSVIHLTQQVFIK